jgi:hypothetical protein
MQENQFEFIDTMCKNLKESDKAVSENVKYNITKHLRRIQNSFEDYFPPNNSDNNQLEILSLVHSEGSLLNQGM